MENSLDNLFEEIDQIKEAGNIVLVKYDGEREENTITCVIVNPKSNEEAIQYHGEDLSLILTEAIAEYKELQNT